MGKVEAEFLKTQNLNPYYGFGTLTAFFIWIHGEEELKTLMDSFNNYKSNLKFTYEQSKSEINFSDLIVKFEKGS